MGVIGPGDVQWMTAGKGIVHEEYHSNAFTREGGTFVREKRIYYIAVSVSRPKNNNSTLSSPFAKTNFQEMCQLWVNLPKKHKMTKPRYQPILKDQIPSVDLPLKEQSGGETKEEPLATVRLIAGSLEDVNGAAKTFSPVQMWDVIMPHAGAEVDIPFPPEHNCIVFVRRGAVQVLSGEDGNEKKSSLGPQDVAIMHLDGSSSLRIRVEEPDTSLLIMGGEPLNEPIAARGPFVMNTFEEIQQAGMDYMSGKF